MNFIIDAQLPESLCQYFHNCDCIHTSKLKRGNQSRDSSINEVSIKENRVVITKDTDFYYSYITSQKPYKLILVKLGNMRLSDLKQYFQNNSNKIIEIIEEHFFIILEKNRIRILE
jgi:predicted nuclease of predicted toxin-antitoxin system